MISISTLSGAQYRLARFYLDKLHTADQAIRRGQANVSYGLQLFDQEWEQIRFWQAWAAKHGAIDEESARLCIEFPLAGLEILSNRNNLADHVAWLESALRCAERLQDSQAERVLLHELSGTCFRLGALEQAERFAIELLKRAEAANDTLSLGRGFYDLATIDEEHGRYAEAERHYRRSLEIFSEIGRDDETGRALHGLGAIALYLGDFEDAYRYFVRSLELVEIIGSKAEVCTALLAISESLMSLDQYHEAEKYVQRAVNLSRTFGFQRILAGALNSLGSLAVEQNQIEGACPHYEEAIQAARFIGSERNVIHGLSSLGYALLRIGNYSEAVARLQEGLQMAREGEMPRYICNLQRNLGNVYLATNDAGSARKALYESLILAKNLGSYSQQVRTVSSIVAYLLQLGQYEQAAICCGAILGEPTIDEPLFSPVCVQLEAALNKERYEMALAQGKTRLLDDVMNEILATLAPD